MRLAIVGVSAMVLITGAAVVDAKTAGHGIDPVKMDQVAREMGVSRADLDACLPQMGLGQARPTLAQRAEMGKRVYACLKQANPDLTDSQFRGAMRALRPVG